MGVLDPQRWFEGKLQVLYKGLLGTCWIYIYERSVQKVYYISSIPKRSNIRLVSISILMVF